MLEHIALLEQQCKMSLAREAPALESRVTALELENEELRRALKRAQADQCTKDKLLAQAQNEVAALRMKLASM